MPKTIREGDWRPDRMLIKTKRYNVQSIERVGNWAVAPYLNDKI